MLRVGVIGGRDSISIIEHLTRIFQSQKIDAVVCHAGWGGPEEEKYDILIYQSAARGEPENIKRLSELLKEKNYLIVNSDEKDIFPFSITAGTILITCGLNSKSSVTASSIDVTEGREKIQYCIQRTLKTVSGERLEPQEFTVYADERESIGSVLTAVTAAMVSDAEIAGPELL